MLRLTQHFYERCDEHGITRDMAASAAMATPIPLGDGQWLYYCATTYAAVVADEPNGRVVTAYFATPDTIQRRIEQARARGCVRLAQVEGG